MEQIGAIALLTLLTFALVSTAAAHTDCPASRRDDWPEPRTPGTAPGLIKELEPEDD